MPNVNEVAQVTIINAPDILKNEAAKINAQGVKKSPEEDKNDVVLNKLGQIQENKADFEVIFKINKKMDEHDNRAQKNK